MNAPLNLVHLFYIVRKRAPIRMASGEPTNIEMWVLEPINFILRTETGVKIWLGKGIQSFETRQLKLLTRPLILISAFKVTK